MNKNLTPILFFAYNRPNHAKQTIEALKKNKLAKDSELFIYSDAAKNKNDQIKVEKVRNYINKINGFKKITVINRKHNWGLANSIIDGVTHIVNKYGKVIVLEDDLITSPYFLKYMNKALEMYKKEKNVASIHGYIYPIKNLPETFFIKGADCWGWATWKNKWSVFEKDGKKLLKEIKKRKIQKEIDFNGSYKYTKMLEDQIKGKNNSWAIRWYISAFLKDMVTLYPGKSYVQNIGFDSQASHCKFETDIYNVKLIDKFRLSKIEAKESVFAKKKIGFYFKTNKKSFYEIIISKIRGMIK